MKELFSYRIWQCDSSMNIVDYPHTYKFNIAQKPVKSGRKNKFILAPQTANPWQSDYYRYKMKDQFSNVWIKPSHPSYVELFYDHKE